MQDEEKLYQHFAESMTTGYACYKILVNEKGEVIDYECTYANPAFGKLLGFAADTLVGKRISEIYSSAVVSELKIMNRYNEVLRGTGEDQYEYFSEVLKKWYHVAVFSPEKDFIATIFTDITALKKAEEEKHKFESQILQTQKLESLGLLAGGIAHDFNNLLMAILGHAELSLLDLSPASPVRPSIEEIIKVSHRAADLTRQLLAYSGKAHCIIQALDLRDVVKEMIHMLEVSISKKVALKFNFAPMIPVINADPEQIVQIIMNLVINASEAIGNINGVISITIGSLMCDHAYLSEIMLGEEIEEGQYVYLEVADTGCGMDKDTIKKIFDPFFSTKFTGRGLGMAAVMGIVRSHHGAIKVYSEPGIGTTVKVLFPSVGQFAKIENKELMPFGSIKNNAIVLLVDDEQIIRSVGKSMLQRLGFQVLTAADGKEALEILTAHRDEIECVILDLTMPNMDGAETFSQIRQIKKDVPIIMSSGYNEQDVIDRFAGKGLTMFIQKPYQMKTLAKKLKEILK